MTIMFFVFVSVVLLNEIEFLLQKKQSFCWKEVFLFPSTRASAAFCSGFIFFFILFVIEVILFSSGKIYTSGLAWQYPIKAALICCLGFSAVGYKYINAQQKNNPLLHQAASVRKKMLIAFSALLLILFLSVQFGFN